MVFDETMNQIIVDLEINQQLKLQEWDKIELCHVEEGGRQLVRFPNLL